MRRKAPLLVVALALIASCGVDTAWANENVPVPESGAYLGLLSSLPGLTNSESITQRESEFSRNFAIDSRYFDWGDGFPSSTQTWDVENGRIPMVTWWWPEHYSDITNGSQDTYIRARAQAIKAFDSPIFLRPAAEMNGDWFAWDGSHNENDPAAFVTAWRHIQDIFDQEGVTNVSWVWSPNSESSPGGWNILSWNNWRNYYPGDDYVDWVGIDGYNWGSLSGGDGWLPFGDIFRAVYDDYASRKPIMIAETGSTESGGDKAKWIRDLGAWSKTHSAIKAVVYFDRTYTSTRHDWAIDTSASSKAAFGALSADQYFGVMAATASAPSGPAPPASTSPPAEPVTSDPGPSADTPPETTTVDVAPTSPTTSAMTVEAPKIQRQHRRVKVRVRPAAGEGVTVHATGEVVLAHAKLRLTRETERIGAGKQTAIALKLRLRSDNRTVLRALRRHQRATAAVNVSFTDAFGTQTSRRVVVKLSR